MSMSYGRCCSDLVSSHITAPCDRGMFLWGGYMSDVISFCAYAMPSLASAH